MGGLATPVHASVVIAIASDPEYFLIDRLIEAYVGCEFEPKFVGWDRLLKFGRFASYRGAPCRYIMRGWGYANWRLMLALPLWCWRFFLSVLREDASIIHAIDFDCAFPAALAGLFRKRVVIYDIQDNFDERRSFPAPVKAILRGLNLWVARRSAEIVVTDENRIVGGLEAFRHKISIVGNCPPDLKSKVRRAAEPGKLVVAAFGNLSSARGIGLLVAASACIQGIRVLMAGRFVEPWLEAKVRSAAGVEYLGVLSQEEALLRTCDADVVFAFYDPSISINRMASSAKWYDAMMAGRPVVSNREIINAPWIEREGFGFTCAYDEESLVYLLKWIRDHPEERVEKGARARKLFESTFNRPAMNKKICEAARRAVGNRPCQAEAVV